MSAMSLASLMLSDILLELITLVENRGDRTHEIVRGPDTLPREIPFRAAECAGLEFQPISRFGCLHS